MLLIDDDDPLEPILGTSGTQCRVCEEKRAATWKGKLRTGEEDVPMCAWCVLYAGSDWGYRNRDEILAMGIRIRQSALAANRKRTHVPELDERHRLPPPDAEKLMLGVGWTSSHLRTKLVGALSVLRGAGG